MQIAGRDGPEYAQLGRGILAAEHVQRPVANCRPSKMRVVESASEIGLEHDWLDPGCPLFRPAQSPGCVQPSISRASQSRLGELPGVEQQARVHFGENLAGDGSQPSRPLPLCHELRRADVVKVSAQESRVVPRSSTPDS
jgi:hypothetical protein